MSRPCTLALIVAALTFTVACVDVDEATTTRLVTGRAPGADAVVLAFDNGTFAGHQTSEDGAFSLEAQVDRTFTVRFYDEAQRQLGHALFAATRDGSVSSQVVPAGTASIDLGTIDASIRSCTGLPVGQNPLEVSDHDDDGIVDIDDEDAIALADVVDFCLPVSVVGG